MSGIDFGINNKEIDSAPIMAGSTYPGKKYYTYEIAREADMPVQTVAKIARDLDLRHSEHAYAGKIDDPSGESRDTVRYDNTAREMILEQARMIREEKKIRELVQMSLLDRIDA
jgi:hypothetical protein